AVVLTIDLTSGHVTTFDDTLSHKLVAERAQYNQQSLACAAKVVAAADIGHSGYPLWRAGRHTAGKGRRALVARLSIADKLTVGVGSHDDTTSTVPTTGR